MGNIPQTKRCSKCGETKTATEFGIRNRKGRGLRSWCKACESADSLARYMADPERAAKQRERYDRDREKKLAACREVYTPRYAERARAYRKRTKAQRSAYNAAWRRANPEKAKDSVIRRRCRLLRAEGKHTAAQWQALKAHYGNRCLCCGRPEMEVALHRDHVIPLTRGGSNWISNIQPLCKECNSAKGEKSTDYRPDAA